MGGLASIRLGWKSLPGESTLAYPVPLSVIESYLLYKTDKLFFLRNLDVQISYSVYTCQTFLCLSNVYEFGWGLPVEKPLQVLTLGQALGLTRNH